MQDKIKVVVNNFMAFLLEKNKRYGNSALSPVKIFSKHISPEQSQATNGILARLDDKLSRIKNADKLRKNDVADTIGYLILLCINKGWEDFTDLLD